MLFITAKETSPDATQSSMDAPEAVLSLGIFFTNELMINNQSSILALVR